MLVASAVLWHCRITPQFVVLVFVPPHHSIEEAHEPISR
jgi:hypothetical protein